MGLLKSDADVAWDAFENEKAASSWAIRSMATHIRRLEDELSAERMAREGAERQATRLQSALRAAAGPDPVSGVRLKGTSY